MYEREWAKVDVDSLPRVVTPPPGPGFKAMHRRAAEHTEGYSSQVRLSPPMIMEDELALKGLAIIEESIYETERELGY